MTSDCFYRECACLKSLCCAAFTLGNQSADSSRLAFERSLIGNKCLSYQGSLRVWTRARVCVCVKESERDWDGGREIICAILSPSVLQAINREQQQCPDTPELLYLSSLAWLMRFLSLRAHTHTQLHREGGLFLLHTDSRQLKKHWPSMLGLFITPVYFDVKVWPDSSPLRHSRQSS